MNSRLARAAALLATVVCAGLAPLRAAAQLLPPLPPPPQPTGSLIVTVTSPAAGSMVSGTFPVNASVSIVGSLTVAGVQFKRDGVNIGTEDTTSPYSVSWDTRTVSNGSHTLTAVARDQLGVLWTSDPVTVTVSNDITRPTVRINQATGQADPTSASPINFTVVFSEPVSGFTGTDVTISGTAGGTKTRTVTGGPSTYNVAVSGMTTTGTVIASIGAGVAQDAAGNTNTASTSTDNSVQFNLPDTARPTVTINQAATQADPTNAAPINFTVVFSEAVSGFTGTDVAVTGTALGTKTVTVSGGPSTYNAAVSGMTTAGTVIATVAAGAAQDAAGNTNTASTSTDNTVTWVPPDTTPPSVTINQATDQADPTIASPIKFTVVFSESVSGFTAADVTISGTAGGTMTVTLTCGSNTYCVEVSGMTTGGTVIATVAAGVAQDAAGNPNTASTSTDNIVTWVPPDTTPPAPTITSFTPTSGPVGTVVTITGTNFAGATAVTFNAVSAGFLVDSATSIRAEVPAGATTGSIRVTTPGGTATSSTSFTVTTPAPTITSFTPTSGPVGTVVTITGTNFAGATAVTFNAVSAGFLVDSATSIRAEVPAGATTGSIRVTTPGGTATSASAFTVEEAPPQPAVTRFEEDSAAVVSSPAGAWVQRGPEIAAFSGGTAGSSDVTGATVTFTFSGTAVSWIGLKCSVCGIATVSIDGGAPTSVDTAGPAAPGSPGLTSEAVFTASGLAADSHTMVITVTGSTTSGGTHIIIDAFDVTGGSGSAANRFEEDNAAVNFNPIEAWVRRGAEVAAFSGGFAGSSDVGGASATFTFAGTAVSWIGLRCSACGIATVSVDGGAANSVDTVGAAAPGSLGLASEAVFSASGLAAGTHTLVITVTGTTTSGGAHIVIDAFDVTP